MPHGPNCYSASRVLQKRIETTGLNGCFLFFLCRHSHTLQPRFVRACLPPPKLLFFTQMEPPPLLLPPLCLSHHPVYV